MICFTIWLPKMLAHTMRVDITNQYGSCSSGPQPLFWPLTNKLHTLCHSGTWPDMKEHAHPRCSLGTQSPD